jgi:hypothetical protein
MIFLVFIKHGGDQKIQHKKLLECKGIRQEKKHGTRNSSVDSAELEDPIFAAEAIVEYEIGEPRLLLRSDEETQPPPKKNASDQ